MERMERKNSLSLFYIVAGKKIPFLICNHITCTHTYIYTRMCVCVYIYIDFIKMRKIVFLLK